MKKFDPVVTHKEVVIVGGGKSSISVLSAVEKYVNKFKGEVAIVHAGGRYVGQYANIKVKQYYCLVGSEALKLETSFNGDYVDGIYIVGPYPRPMGTILSDFMKDVFELKQIEYCSEYNDSLLAISLQVAIELGAEIVSLIGFDGYDNNNDKKMIEVAAENQYILNQFSKYRNNIRFLTPSTYNYINQESIYCYL